MLQEIPDMQQSMVSYNEARQRINDRRRSRGFWPTGKGKGQGGFKDGSRPYRKGVGKSGKEELLARIAKTHCKLCGALGHWRAECPQRKEARETANVAFSMPSEASDAEEETSHAVVFEEFSEQECTRCETCFVASCYRKPVFCEQNVEDVKAFWGKKLNKIRRFRMGSRDGAVTRPSCINGAKFFPIDACCDDECQSSQQSASSNASETAHAARVNDTKCPTTSCNDGKPRIVLRSFRDWKPIDGDSSIPRKLGKQDRGLLAKSYIKWILARADNLSEDMADFASYARARNQLEQLANNPVP
ncbi:unnamed protein product [Cladocopium goreaui]|uniref:CCHC-type domain-containing protein n=1 Tax=Cladocopium goreaui TaxID=2562237 RepID=A0A9P1DSE8_9DINO|nr:unnamed protein product [Cladocopium goreaui]